MLSRAADGSLRDALSLLDQAIAYCGGKLEEEPVAAMLGTIDRDHVMKLLRFLAENDGQGLMQLVAEIDQQFPDYRRLLDDLARLLQRATIYQVLGSSDHDDEFDVEELKEIADQISPADLQLFYQTALIGRRDLDLSPDPRSGAEMTLLRMLAFRPAAAAQNASAGGGESKSRKSTSVPKAAAATRPASVQSTKAASTSWQEDVDWAQLISKMDIKGATRLLATNCALLRRDGDTLYFSLDGKSEAMLTRARQEALAEALSQQFGETLRVSIEVGEAAPETPVQEKSRMEGERYEAAKASLEADPNIKTLQTMFGAELKADTIEPINPSQSE